jgi:DNA-directed RNA polymerase specialized sigma24 family protein
MEKHKMQEVMDIAEEYRCFEDFDFRKSRQKTDFFRRWYHTRAKHTTVSLESFQEDYTAAHDGQEWDLPDDGIDVEQTVTSQIQVQQFLKTLTEKDRQMLTMRMEGLTHQEIADKLGYRNHSGVLKRIRKIGEQYENFTGTDLGF